MDQLPAGAGVPPIADYRFTDYFFGLHCTLSFAICKSVKLSLGEVRPAAVTKIEVLDKPKPTRWVHGGPVWVQNVSWRTYFTRKLRLTFAKGLQTGQKVKQKFILRAPGYRPDAEVVTQTIYNP